MKYLLAFTIGPVQTLVNSSRKIMDMYAGSKLLSGLMRKAVRMLKNKNGISLLFPVEDNAEADRESDMPNRLIAEITSDDEAYPAQIGQGLEKHVKEVFLKKSHELLESAGICGDGWLMAERQLRNFLEAYWVAEPYGGRCYKEVYSSLFRRLQEVKGIRPFAQSVEPYNRKCMLFPDYNAIFAKKDEDGRYPSNINMSDVYDITASDSLRYLVKKKEALSAAAMVKRVFLFTKPYETYSLRLMLLLSRAGNVPVNGQGQGDMLANAVYDIENGNTPNYDEYNQEMWYAAQELCGRLRQEGTRLSSYYALVKLDGDSMGQEFLNRDTPEEQQKLSRSIAKFAMEIPRIIKECKGLPAYAGGEDFLGFLPLDTLFDCLERLRRAFREHTGLTFSAGVAVAHLMKLLKETAAAAEELEGLAKRAEGKNSCVMGIYKRSGDMAATPPLCFDEKTGRAGLNEFKLLVEALACSECSKSLLYNLGGLFRRFLEEGAQPDNQAARVLVHEAAAASSAENPDMITDRIMTFYDNDGGLEGFMNILNASSFLAREVNRCIT